MNDERNRFTQSEWKGLLPRRHLTSDDTELFHLGKEKPDSFRHSRPKSLREPYQVSIAQGDILQTEPRHSSTNRRHDRLLPQLALQPYRALGNFQPPSTAASHDSRLNRRMLPGRISPGPPSTTPVRVPSPPNDEGQLINPHSRSSIGSPASSQSAPGRNELQPLPLPLPTASNSPLNQACAAIKTCADCIKRLVYGPLTPFEKAVLKQRIQVVCVLMGTYCAFSHITNTMDQLYPESNRLVRAGCLSAWMCVWVRNSGENLGLWPPVLRSLVFPGATPQLAAN
jgi:hypothetical protein